ncbi:response regulator [Pontiella agarivorans]|uniref:Response regulator n=1 Tax=Pontiella agarivorans TaxID=3038953 RepID=A0ABU5MT50_9BACT|nr:response regulator [Pontiella agarivorans]MDZ8117256.1 response regulator [Pontiella agarivorans]
MNFSNKDEAMELNAKVLVLDDEPLVRLLICSKLEQAGAQVSEAGCCADALKLMRNTRFDAALFDYRLPDGNGIDVVRLLRKEGFELPIAMLSGEAADLEEKTVNDLGICAVFPKPPDVALIARTLAREAGCSTIKETVRVGRYVYVKADPADTQNWSEWAGNDWLAVDFSAWPSDSLPSAMIDFIRMPRRGMAVVGATPALCEYFDALDLNIEFAAGIDELAALSRRPTTPLERAALLESVQPGKLTESHA